MNVKNTDNNEDISGDSIKEMLEDKEKKRKEINKKKR